jgi:hypothetical protein
MGSRELKSRGIEMFEKGEVGKENEKSRWIAVCGREGGNV